MSGYTVAHLDEIDGWELWAPLKPLYDAGDYAGVVDGGKPLADAYPRYADFIYNVACCESLAGWPADAIDHLRHAIDVDEKWRGYAKSDSDFDAIRDVRRSRS